MCIIIVSFILYIFLYHVRLFHFDTIDIHCKNFFKAILETAYMRKKTRKQTKQNKLLIQQILFLWAIYQEYTFFEYHISFLTLSFFFCSFTLTFVPLLYFFFAFILRCCPQWIPIDSYISLLSYFSSQLICNALPSALSTILNDFCTNNKLSSFYNKNPIQRNKIEVNRRKWSKKKYVYRTHEWIK